MSVDAPALCGICNSEPPKYKCPALNCPLQYCSLQCYKTHKPLHQDADIASDAAAPDAASTIYTPADLTPADQTLRLQPETPQGLIQNLPTNPDYLRVIQENPSLMFQLREIYAQTREENWNAERPAPPGRGRGRGGGKDRHRRRSQGPFSQEKASERAVRTLGRLRAYEIEGKGLRQFGDLVGQLLAGGEDAAKKEQGNTQAGHGGGDGALMS